MANISDLKPALRDQWLKKQAARIDPQSLFAIAYDDISRQESVAANGDNADPVYFGRTAEAQMHRLREAFGFDRLPETWSEFKGMLLYCQMLQGMLMGPRNGPLAEDIRRHGLNVIKRYFPNDYDAAVAFFDDDIERLRKVHLEDDTLVRLAREHKEYDDC